MVRCRYFEVWRSRFLEQCNWKCGYLLVRRLKVLLVRLVNVGNGADRLIGI